MYTRILFGIVSLVILPIMTLNCTQVFGKESKVLKVCGAGPAIPLVDPLSESYSHMNPDVSIILSAGDLNSGVDMLVAREADVALIEGKVNVKVEAMAFSKGLDLIHREIGYMIF